ncbi:MAG TPA: hypothetical protein DHU96_04990 [Actinobacteria bacterium]|nr:hypothetical protein [Actinomycetota bacterium]
MTFRRVLECPAQHTATRPYVITEKLAPVSGGGQVVVRRSDNCCPACPDVQLTPHMVVPGGAEMPAHRCPCCEAIWRHGIGRWECLGFGRLVRHDPSQRDAGNQLSCQAHSMSGTGPVHDRQLRNRALTAWLLSARALHAGVAPAPAVSSHLCEHDGRRYAVVTGTTTQVLAVYRVSATGRLTRQRRWPPGITPTSQPPAAST